MAGRAVWFGWVLVIHLQSRGEGEAWLEDLAQHTA